MSLAVLPKHVAAVIRCQKNPLKALEMFNAVKKDDGFKHNLLTYKCMIEKLGSHGEFEAMEHLVEEMRKISDNGLLEGVYISVIKSYGKKGRIQEAVDVFERMDFYSCEPSVQSYNAIMNILVEYGYFNQAHKVYMRMRDKDITPDVYTFTIRMKSFCRTNRPHVALRLLHNMLSQGCVFNAVAYCTVIGGFYDVNCQVEANELFEEMLGIGIIPNVTTFNKLIHTLCLCRNGKLDEAVKMLDGAERGDFTPDVVTYNTIICGLCKSLKVVEAESFLFKMVNSGFKPDAFAYNTIIDGYCKLGMIQNADKVLNDAAYKGFVPDQFTYISLIYGSCENGDTDRAISLFHEATSKGIKANVILYNTLIKGLSRHGLILEAFQLMNEMPEKGCNPDTWTYNTIINGLCKMGCVSDATDVMNIAMNKGILPDIFTFNTLIDGYCKLSKLADAIEILNTMWEHGIAPDVITYNTVLNGLCKASSSDEVMEMFKVMVEKGCDPNIITYNILMESLCRSRKFTRAFDLLEEIESKGLSPDVVIFGTLINGFCENGDLDGGYKLFRRMERQYKLSQTTATYNIMINAFSEKLEMDMTELLFSEMSKTGCVPNNYTYRCMIDGFCKKGDCDSSYRFLLDNIEKELLPSLPTFGQVINCLCMKHRLREAVSTIRLMVHKGIVPDAVHTIFEADKKNVAAPKIVLEDLLKNNHINYYAYELLYDAIRDKKLMKPRHKRSKFAAANDELLDYRERVHI
nr:putative pentatricopeptide repeat-containing protein At1g74580 [Ipomoea batatas]